MQTVTASEEYLVWCLNGQFHRIDGPAIECADGSKSWHLNGRRYTEKAFYKALKELQ